jgi:hypothetical protein
MGFGASQPRTGDAEFAENRLEKPLVPSSTPIDTRVPGAATARR